MNLKKKVTEIPSLEQFIRVKDKKQKKPLKNFIKGKISISGHNNKGRITIWGLCGGHKKAFRQLTILDSTLDKFLVERIENDPNRSAKIMRLFSISKNKHFYTLAPSGIEEGQTLFPNTLRIGNRLILEKFPLGSKLFNIGTNFRPKKGILQKAAGTFGILIQKTLKTCLIRLSSGKLKELGNKNYATLGFSSNLKFHENIIGKSGRNYWCGKRSNVRGVAMNPIDHPHGGGEGKSSGGRPSVSPWAKPAHRKKRKI